MKTVEHPSGILGTPQLKTRYDPESNDEFAYTIVNSVATVANVDPVDIDQQIFTVVDVDALEQIFPDFGSASATRGHLQFEFYGHTVAVYSDGTIEVYDTPQ